MSQVIQVTTSFGGIDSETGEAFDNGSHGEVVTFASTGSGIVKGDDFDEIYSDHASQAVVTRNGSTVTINSISD